MQHRLDIWQVVFFLASDSVRIRAYDDEAAGKHGDTCEKVDEFHEEVACVPFAQEILQGPRRNYRGILRDSYES